MNSTIMDRRRFLKYSGLLGLSLGAGVLMPTGSEAVRFDRQMQKVSSNRVAIGTFVSMTLIHPSRDEAQEAMELAFVEIDRLSRLLSRFDGATPISALNREGMLTDIPPEVLRLIRKSMGYYQLTGGAFDVTVKPVVDLFAARFSDPERGFPSQSEMRHVLHCVGSDKILMEEKAIRFLKPGHGHHPRRHREGLYRGQGIGNPSKPPDRQPSHQCGGRHPGRGAKGRRRALGDHGGGPEKAEPVSGQDPALRWCHRHVGELRGLFRPREDVPPHYRPENRALPTPHHQRLGHRTHRHGRRCPFNQRLCHEPRAGHPLYRYPAGCECFLVSAKGAPFKSEGWSPRAI